MDLKSIELLDKDQLLEAIRKAGREDVVNILDNTEINGQTLINITGVELINIGSTLPPSAMKKLSTFVAEVKQNPSIILSQLVKPTNTQEMNINTNNLQELKNTLLLVPSRKAPPIPTLANRKPLLIPTKDVLFLPRNNGSPVANKKPPQIPISDDLKLLGNPLVPSLYRKLPLIPTEDVPNPSINKLSSKNNKKYPQVPTNNVSSIPRDPSPLVNIKSPLTPTKDVPYLPTDNLTKKKIPKLPTADVSNKPSDSSFASIKKKLPVLSAADVPNLSTNKLSPTANKRIPLVPTTDVSNNHNNPLLLSVNRKPSFTPTDDVANHSTNKLSPTANKRIPLVPTTDVSNKHSNPLLSLVNRKPSFTPTDDVANLSTNKLSPTANKRIPLVPTTDVSNNQSNPLLSSANKNKNVSYEFTQIPSTNPDISCRGPYPLPHEELDLFNKQIDSSLITNKVNKRRSDSLNEDSIYEQVDEDKKHKQLICEWNYLSSDKTGKQESETTNKNCGLTVTKSNQQTILTLDKNNQLKLTKYISAIESSLTATTKKQILTPIDVLNRPLPPIPKVNGSSQVLRNVSTQNSHILDPNINLNETVNDHEVVENIHKGLPKINVEKKESNHTFGQHIDERSNKTNLDEIENNKEFIQNASNTVYNDSLIYENLPKTNRQNKEDEVHENKETLNVSMSSSNNIKTLTTNPKSIAFNTVLTSFTSCKNKNIQQINDQADTKAKAVTSNLDIAALSKSPSPILSFNSKNTEVKNQTLTLNFAKFKMNLNNVLLKKNTSERNYGEYLDGSNASNMIEQNTTINYNTSKSESELIYGNQQDLISCSFSYNKRLPNTLLKLKDDEDISKSDSELIYGNQQDLISSSFTNKYNKRPPNIPSLFKEEVIYENQRENSDFDQVSEKHCKRPPKLPSQINTSEKINCHPLKNNNFSPPTSIVKSQQLPPHQTESKSICENRSELSHSLIHKKEFLQTSLPLKKHNFLNDVAPTFVEHSESIYGNQLDYNLLSILGELQYDYPKHNSSSTLKEYADQSIYENITETYLKNEISERHVYDHKSEQNINIERKDADTPMFNLENEPFYRKIDNRSAKELLKNLPDGAFIFRPGQTYFLTLILKYKTKFYNVGIELTKNNTIRGNIAVNSDILKAPEFKTLSEFIDYFSKNPFSFNEKGALLDICLVSVESLKRKGKFNISSNDKRTVTPDLPLSTTVVKNEEFYFKSTNDEDQGLINKNVEQIPSTNTFFSETTDECIYENCTALQSNQEDINEHVSYSFNFNSEPFYRNTDRKGAKLLLKDLSNGAFLFRPSEHYHMVLTIIFNGKFYNLGIDKTSDNKIRLNATMSSDTPSFDDLKSFVDYFTKQPVTFVEQGVFLEIFLDPVLPGDLF